MLHLVGQPRRGDRDTVLHQDLRRVDVGSRLEHDIDAQRAVADRLRRDVQHVVDAVHFLLDRCGNGFRKHFGGGTGIDGAYADGGRRDFRVFRYRQRALHQAAGDGDDDRQDRREDRPINEEVGEAHGGQPRRTVQPSWLGDAPDSGGALPPGRRGRYGSAANWLLVAWISVWRAVTATPGCTNGLARPPITTRS